jgi:anti-anti-sigma factor
MHLRTGLIVRVARESGRTRVAVHGEIDLDSADMLNRVLGDCLRADAGGVDVDLTAVGFFDCSGLNTLLRARALAEAFGVRFTLGAVSAPVARVLDLTHCRDAFPEAVVAGGPRRRGESLRLVAGELVATG